MDGDINLDGPWFSPINLEDLKNKEIIVCNELTHRRSNNNNYTKRTTATNGRRALKIMAITFNSSVNKKIMDKF